MKYIDRIMHQSILAVTNQATYERIIQVAATRILCDASEELSGLVRDFSSMTNTDRVNQIAFVQSNLSALTSMSILCNTYSEGNCED